MNLHQYSIVLFVCLLVLPSSAQTSYFDNLNSLFVATSGSSSWQRHDHWGDITVSVCAWYGVTCDVATNQLVVKVDLSNNNLTLAVGQGTFSTILFSSIPVTVTLVSLNISGNRLGGSVPAGFFGTFTKLEVLDLSRNLLRGEIPTSLATTTGQHMIRLNLSHNLFSGVLPPFSATVMLSSLTQLDVSANRLTGAIPVALLSATPLLSKLCLSHNFLVGSLYSLFSTPGVVVLQELSLDHNYLLSDIPSAICSYLRLTSINFEENRLFGGIPSCMVNLSQLVTVNLAHNTLRGAVPCNQWFGSSGVAALLPNIQTLLFTDNDLSGVFCPIPGSHGLVNLHLDNNDFSGLVPPLLGLQLADVRLGGSNQWACPLPSISSSSVMGWSDVPPSTSCFSVGNPSVDLLARPLNQATIVTFSALMVLVLVAPVVVAAMELYGIHVPPVSRLLVPLWLRRIIQFEDSG